MGRGYGIYAGIFLISTAALSFEIALTRVLSVALWYHFAFLVISIALFGIAASGTYLSLFPTKRELNDSLSLFSLGFSITAIGSYVLSNRIPFDPFRFSWDRSQLLFIFLYYLLLSVPFFFFGLCIALSFTKRPSDAGKLYFANLLGSGTGALGVLGLFSIFNGSGVLVLSALLGSAAGFFFSGKRRFWYGAVFILLLALLYAPVQPLQINMSPYKPLKLALRYPDSRLLSTQWNSISRVDVVESGYVRYAPGLSLTFQAPLPSQLGLTVDGDALSAITKFNGSPLEFTGFLTSSSPYKLRPSAEVLIIEPGGGLGVVQALSNGASKVKVLDPNSLIIETVRGLEGFSAVYSDPRVDVVEAEARSFLGAQKEEFDIIQLGLLTGAPASSTGVYALTENYLFTVEAFKEYLEHLPDGGILCITRWLRPPPRESLRTVSLAVEALEELNVAAPEKNIAILRSWGSVTILVKKTAWTREEIEEINEFAESRRFDLVYVPGILESQANIYNRFSKDEYYHAVNALLTAAKREDFYESYLFDVSPTRDENPFFFHFFKPDRLKETYKSTGEKWQVFVEGGYIVYLLFMQALLLCILFILLPLAGFKSRITKTPRTLGIIFYFFLIGLSFMLVEIPLIQRFILFLGNPVYAVSTVLFGLLVFSGMGSFYTGRLLASLAHLKYIVILLFATVLFYLSFLPWFLGIGLTINMSTKYVVSVLALAPLGFLMGMPLPIGIRLVEKIDSKLIPWAWAANGSASVLGSILAVIIAMHTGFSRVMILASFTYVLSLIGAITAFAPHQQEEQSARW